MFYSNQGNILWISYETYCLKVSLNKKLILSQFSQKEITIFFFLNEKKNKTKKMKKKTEKSYLQFVSPTLISKKKVLDGLILGRKRKIVTFGSICSYVNFFFNFIKYKSVCTILLKKTKTHIFEFFLIFLKLKIETKNKHACKLTFLSTMFSKE